MATDLVAAATHNVAAVAHRAEHALTDSKVVDRLPGHSVATVGYGLVGVAALLDLIPGATGSGFWRFGYDDPYFIHAWAFAMVALAVVATVVRVMPERPWPPAAKSPAIPAALAMIAVAEVYVEFGPALIPVLLTLGAAILAYDAMRTGLARETYGWLTTRADAIGNRTTTGVALVVAALAISWVPGDGEIIGNGLVVIGYEFAKEAWTAVLVAAGVAAIVADREGPLAPYRAWIQGGTALLYAAWALAIFEMSLLNLVWLAGAALLAYDQVTRARSSAGKSDVRVRLFATGPAQLVLAGVPLCIFAMTLRWGTVGGAGFYIGGFGADGTYDPMKFFNQAPQYGVNAFGLGPADFTFSPLVVAALLALVVLALWESSRPLAQWMRLAPAVLVAAVAVWALSHYGTEWGPLAFGAGLLLLGAAAVLTALPGVTTRAEPAPEA